MDDKAHEWKVFRVHRACLDQEFVPPAIKCVETLAIRDIETQNTAVGATVEGDSQRLEAFLSGGIPQLHRHQAVVDKDFLCKEIGTFRCVS